MVIEIMARMNIVLPDDLEKRFKEKIFKTYGMKKGNISMAIEEAIELWIRWREKLLTEEGG